MYIYMYVHVYARGKLKLIKIGGASSRGLQFWLTKNTKIPVAKLKNRRIMIQFSDENPIYVIIIDIHVHVVLYTII